MDSFIHLSELAYLILFYSIITTADTAVTALISTIILVPFTGIPTPSYKYLTDINFHI